MENNNNHETSTESKEVKEQLENNVETKPVKTDLHSYQSPFTPIDKKEKIDPDYCLSFPTGKASESDDYFTKIADMKDKDFKSLIDIDIFRRYVTSTLYQVPNHMLDKYIPTKDRIVNDVQYGEKKFNLKNINFTTKEKISNAAAVARLTSIFNIGEIIQVPLWNSGFWVTIVPPSQRDLVNLEIQLSREELDLGRVTSNFIYSHYSVIFVRILSNFIVQNIREHTLSLPAGEDILSYIKLSDLYPLILGLLSSIYPKGMDVNVFCNNRFQFKEDGSPICDFTTVIKTDPKKLLSVDRSRLTDQMLTQMAIRTPNSVSVDSVKNYQELLEISHGTVDIESSIGKKVEFKFKNPSIADAIRIGEEWVGEIIKTLENVFIKSDDISTKNDMISKAVDMSILTVYSSYIRSISIPEDNLIIDSYTSILDALERFSVDDVIVKNFLDAIDKYISRSSVSLVGIPSFTCPTCNAENITNENESFKEFIPIEVIKYFFENLKLRIQNQKMMLNS